MSVSCIVNGDPVGYYAQGKRPNWTRMKRYHAYKQSVQLVARVSGVVLPLAATKAAPLIIRTVAYFRNGVHCDPENVHKGIKDALFYGAGGSGDKHTGGSYEPPRYDAANPRVEITIEETRGGCDDDTDRAARKGFEDHCRPAARAHVDGAHPGSGARLRGRAVAVVR